MIGLVNGATLKKCTPEEAHKVVDEFAGQDVDLNSREILVSCLVKCKVVKESTSWIPRADALIEACERALTLLEKAQDKSNSSFLAKAMIGGSIPMSANADFVEEQTALLRQRIIISRLHTYLLTIRSGGQIR